MLQKRRLGRTGHFSSVAIMGTAAFSKLTQAEVDKAVELCIGHGINHIDVAPSYGDAEKLIGPWLEKHRKEVFLGCKTEKRGETEAHDSLHRSLERLRIERFDLLQLHAVTSMPDLDKAMDGALKALIRAKEEGLTKWIGITGHGIESPTIYVEALRRFDFDTVMFPVNPVLWSNSNYRRNAEELLGVAEARDIGIMAIKAAGRRAWEGERRYSTWYEPWDDAEHIRQGVHFALSQRAVAGVCTVGDVRLLPMFLNATESYTPMDVAEQERVVVANVDTAPAFQWLL